VHPPGPTYARIDLAALTANFALARKAAGTRSVIAVVKAEAYGHGSVPVARALVRAGCERLAVARVSEVAPLREAGLAVPILVLGGVHDAEEARATLALHATAVVSQAGHVALLADAARRRGGPAPVHVEIDTGMRRLGVPVATAADFLARVSAEPALRLEGAFTHLARADEADPSPSVAQLRDFRRVLEDARARGVGSLLVHAANSAGLLADARLAKELPEAGAVRPGILLYGVDPRLAPAERAPLRPVMTFCARVAQVREVRAGDAVGYGATWRAPAAGRIATLAVGYGDGVPWSLANRGVVLLGGRRAPIVGRVSMDAITVDVGAEDVEPGDEAILFGAGLPVEEVAAAAGTLAYEVLVRVGSRVPRLTVGDEHASAV
jgi:alanine racemase